jgi:hypothetical protein
MILNNSSQISDALRKAHAIFLLGIPTEIVLIN